MSLTADNRILKLILVGDGGVGKSCILSRYCRNTFDLLSRGTVGIDFLVKSVEVEGVELKLQIWDTAGQERFRNIISQYYRGALGVIIVYDVTCERSFNKL
eukprot:gene19405-23236_t